MEIKNKILKTELVNWQELKDLQPNNLKNPYFNEKTKQSLIKNGFSFAFYVWEDKNGDKYLVDGHLRSDLLRELINDNYIVPDQLTCTFLDLKTRKEAVKYLLEVFNTKKNPIDETAMVDWFKVEGIEIEEVEVASLDVEKSLSPDDLNTDFELPKGDKEPFQQMTFTMASEQANQLKRKLDEIKQTDEYKYCETFGNENSNGNALYTLITRFYG
jgi:hypothetical protein